MSLGSGTYFDNLQRETRRESKAFAATAWATATTTYDSLGRKSALTKPAGSGKATTSLTYDTLNRVVQEHVVASTGVILDTTTRRSNGQNDVRYWRQDHLGSLTAIGDANGNVQQRFTYDAWGKRTASVGNLGSEERGYTGHEHLVEVGLTHMNGRIYFDGIGRFLQADPIVQAPFDGQSYNRYSYVINNPLSLTDPSGYSWWTKWRRPILAIAAAITMQYYAMPGLLAGAVGSGAIKIKRVRLELTENQ